MRPQVNIKKVEDQQEVVSNKKVSEAEKEAFLAQYLKNQELPVQKMPQKHQPKPYQKRINGDQDTQKSNHTYYQTRYRGVEETDLNLKIEIKSDMKF